MKKHVALLGILGGLMVAVAFNNCSPEHVGTMGSDGFSVAQETTFVPCAFTDERDLFGKTYHPFVMQNCASCHIEGGQGKGAFASAGLLVAYNAFSVVGYEKVSEFAVNPGHKPPNTGSQHDASINLLKDQWVKGLENIAACKGGATGPDPVVIDEATRLDTRSKAINLAAEGDTATISWDLSRDIIDKAGITLPTVPGARLSLNFRRFTLGTKPVYEVSSPTLTAGNTDLKIKSILVKLNGKTIKNQTTFLYVDEAVRAGQSLRLAPGAMVVDGAISVLDVVSLSIGSLEPTVLPPPPVMPKVAFSAANVTIPERVNAAAVGSSNNFYQVTVRLDTPNDQQYVTATLGILTTGYGANTRAVNRRTTETVTLPQDNRNLAIDRWDWDFSVDTLAVVFAPGETSKTLTFRIANDDRRETNEQIRVGIASVVNAERDTVNQTLTITIQDDDPLPNPEVPTFSSLMVPGGILYQNCYLCHNSVDNRGGYNLSDYDLMINNGVLVPGNTSSMMFRRMNETIPGLRTMPLDRLLDPALRRQVEAWILNGAKND